MAVAYFARVDPGLGTVTRPRAAEYDFISLPISVFGRVVVVFVNYGSIIGRECMSLLPIRNSNGSHDPFYFPQLWTCNIFSKRYVVFGKSELFTTDCVKVRKLSNF